MPNPVGIRQGYSGRFGVAAPPNMNAPQGSNPVTSDTERAWWASGPAMVVLFLVVGYILVFRTLR
jgi:hypothetical protein